jgi:hypothetical protein
MKVPEYLVVAQWALLFALGFLVIVAFRQLGRVFVRGTSHPDLGPPTGTMAASLEYLRVSDGTAQQVQPGRGEPLLAAFVDPTCISCENLVLALEGARQETALGGVRVLLLTTDPPRYLSVSEVFQNTTFEVGQVVAQRNLETYRASATPLLVAIDQVGIVRWAGAAATPEEVRSAIAACRASAGLESAASRSDTAEQQT